MASLFGHAALALSVAPLILRRRPRGPLLIAGVAAAVLPDADVLGFALGVDYGDLLGHRGLTHSVLFAAVLGSVLVAAVPRQGEVPGRRVWVYLSLAALSHGLLDAATNGGLGVAFLAPFDTHRFFWPWRPIEVSPIGVGAFLSTRAMAVLKSEAVWVGIPSVIFLAAGRFFLPSPSAQESP